mgnify:CR=1 FL=1
MRIIIQTIEKIYKVNKPKGFKYSRRQFYELV